MQAMLIPDGASTKKEHAAGGRRGDTAVQYVDAYVLTLEIPAICRSKMPVSRPESVRV